MINKDYGLTGIFKWVKERIVRGVEITLILYDAWDGDTNTYFTNLLEVNRVIEEEGGEWTISSVSILNEWIQLCNLHRYEPNRKPMSKKQSWRKWIIGWIPAEISFYDIEKPTFKGHYKDTLPMEILNKEVEGYRYKVSIKELDTLIGMYPNTYWCVNKVGKLKTSSF